MGGELHYLDLLWTRLDLLWIRRIIVADLLHTVLMSVTFSTFRCCGFAVAIRFVVDLFRTCGFVSICCTHDNSTNPQKLKGSVQEPDNRT